MAGQAAEQIIAGVILSERLAVTMYGAIHRASFGGQRNLRGLVVDPKMLAEDAFRIPLTDPKAIGVATQLDHPNIVPTVTVESGGPDVVIVTRGVGRYVTVQDLITAAKSRTKQGGKLSTPIAALIARSVIEALAVAHRAGVIHGAVHPRSVLVDEDGRVRLGDFIVGRALTTAVAQGAESSLWRGLAGYIAPELVVGEDPTPAADVFAVGAMLFTMLSGEVPPGTLRVTPAIERLVQRALDTDMHRRYRSASDMLDNLLEALEDDRWDLANEAELISEAGLSRADTNVDDATEDLLASLGTPSGVQLAPLRPSIDLRAEHVAKKRKSSTGGSRLDALLDGIDEGSGVTSVDDEAFPPRDPISDLIRTDSRRKDIAVSSSRVPSLDDPDDDTPLPAPVRDSQVEVQERRRASTSSQPYVRGQTTDEAAAFAAIGDLEQGSKRRGSSAALRPTEPQTVPPAPARATPRVDPPDLDDFKAPRLKSPLRGVFGGLVVIGILGGAGYIVYTKYNADEAAVAERKKQREKDQKDQEALEAKLREGQPDPGAIEVNAEGAGVWLRLGRTPLDTPILLPANQQHDLVLLHDGQDATEAQVNGTSWTGAQKSLKASLSVTLKPAKGKPPVLPVQPSTPVLASTGVVGSGVVHIESTPSDSEAWLFIGVNHVRFNELWAGRDYELAVVKPGFKTQHVMFKADEWRDGGDPSLPIDVAKKKQILSRDVVLEPEPKKGK